MGVKLQSSSGGSVEIAAPVTASNYVLTAPTTSSTIDTLARTGNVLQVVQGITDSYTSTSSTTPTTTSLSATITPISVSSKILCLASFSWTGSATSSGGFILYRNSTALNTKISVGRSPSVGSTASIVFFDVPSTASTTTYTVYVYADSGSTIYLGQPPSGFYNTITLMEIAG